VRKLRNRTFGVEIECGYDGDGGGCGCACECYTCEFCTQGCRESLGPDEDCSCSCECEECSYCIYGCECSSHDDTACEVACNLLYDNGLSHWTDEIHNDGSGCEIPSPVLQGKEGLAELKRVMELLQRNGFYTGSEDGLHVHHGAEEFAEDDRLLATLVELWEENIEHIERLVDPYRRVDGGGHTWCNRRRGNSRVREWERFKETKDTSLIPLGRYFSLNVENVRYGQELEIRLHEGTLDFNKTAAWIHFGQSFLEWAKKQHKRNNIVTCASPGEVLRLTRTSPKSTRTLLAVAAAN
jgi:hypothetical protein